ncbi:MAG: 6-pyruvoyl trahydropterin synthase family protein [Tepidisphaeraceae bacterium]
MGFEISVTRTFSASHQLRLYDGSLEPLHGHNWQVRMTVSSPRLDSMGVVMDFHELLRLADELIRPLHNRHLNEVEELVGTNPSAEKLAQHFATALTLPQGVSLVSVEVWETPDCRACFRPSGR